MVSGDVARYIAAVRLQARWRTIRLHRAEQRDVEEKLLLAEQREEALRIAKINEEAKVQMYLEMESTLTTLANEHAQQLAAAQQVAMEKEAALQKVFDIASPRVSTASRHLMQAARSMHQSPAPAAAASGGGASGGGGRSLIDLSSPAAPRAPRRSPSRSTPSPTSRRRRRRRRLRRRPST